MVIQTAQINIMDEKPLSIIDLTRQVSLEQILIYNDSLYRPNPDDTGPIVRHPMGLPIPASCDTAWI